MKSTAVDVKGYIAEQPDEWQPTLVKLRARCRAHLRGYTEVMAYGMPSYTRAGRVEISFAKQARYLSLYVLKQPVLDAHRARLTGLAVGKGCIRFRSPQQIDWNLVTDILTETAVTDSEIC